LLATVLRNCGRRVWLGGNIGVSLLAELPTMLPSDVVVLELSSFQLAHLSPQARMPAVAIVTSCTANHLDWHGSLADYVAAKQRLISRLPQHGALVLGPMAHELSAWAALTDCRLLLSPQLPAPELPSLNIPGQHNRSNAACVVAAARHLGCDLPTIHAAVAQFQGLAHRLEIVANRSGRRVYNDSKATSPAAAAAALSAVPGPVWWLAGGHPKGADFTSLAEQAVRRARGAAIFGAARGQLAAALAKADAQFPLYVVEHMREALDWCWRQSSAGDAILLSPGCASYDQYVDYADRGNRFVALIRDLD
jgi:UDP-N-acetylmuramoylalanine--D-glutamate ligase